MITDCPNCGHMLQNPTCVVSCTDDLLRLSITCPECEELFELWFNVKFLGITLDDCIATIPHRFFYPAEGQTEESMIAAGVKRLDSALKGS